MVKILIHVDGGLIQSISADGPVDVYVVDYDIDGVENDHPHLTKFCGDDCLLYKFDPDNGSDAVNLAEKTWKSC